MIGIDTPGVRVWIWFASDSEQPGPRPFLIAKTNKRSSSCITVVKDVRSKNYSEYYWPPDTSGAQLEAPRSVGYFEFYDCYQAKIDERRAKGVDVRLMEYALRQMKLGKKPRHYYNP